tara:strand:- start:2671 stop:3006 length:336 start_codon:yes stop_codon:yes gene_type:complete
MTDQVILWGSILGGFAAAVGWIISVYTTFAKQKAVDAAIVETKLAFEARISAVEKRVTKAAEELKRVVSADASLARTDKQELHARIDKCLTDISAAREAMGEIKGMLSVPK